MRIQIFVPNYPSLYKPYYDSQFSDLLERGHDVRIFSLSNLDGEVNEKVREYGLDERTRHYFPDDLRSLRGFAPGLARSVAASPRRGIDAVWQAGRGARGWRERAKHAARILSLPADRPDLALVHSVRTMQLFPWLRAVHPGVPVAMFYHGGGLWGGSAEVFSHADFVFTNTEYSVAEAESLGCPREKLHILPVGFDLREYQPPDPRPYRPGGRLRVLSASRLGEEKGHTDSLEAISRLVRSGVRDLHYTIVGGGREEMRRMLQARVQKLELGEYVTFAGSPPTRAVIAAMANADVLLLPSFEYQGIVEMQAACVQEAALMGALSITSRTGGVPESTPPSLRDLSIECRDVEGLADSIRRVRELPEPEIRERAALAREWVAERYDIRRLNERMLGIVGAGGGGR